MLRKPDVLSGPRGVIQLSPGVFSEFVSSCSAVVKQAEAHQETKNLQCSAERGQYSTRRRKFTSNGRAHKLLRQTGLCFMTTDYGHNPFQTMGDCGTAPGQTNG